MVDSRFLADAGAADTWSNLRERATPLLADYLTDSAKRWPDKTALVWAGLRLTYAELDGRSNALAHTLVQRGVCRGDRVLVFSDNTPETIVAFWAVLKANAVVSIINPLTKADKLAYMLKDSGATALIAAAHLSRAFGPAVSQAPQLALTVVAGPADLPPHSVPGFLRWDEALAEGARMTAPRRQNIDIDLACIIYTSGSTGDAKGVMMTHRSMLTAAKSISTYLELAREDVVLCPLPLAFDYGLYQMIMAFSVGATLVLERSFAFPPHVLALVAAEGVTVFPGVPTIFTMLARLRNLADYDFSSIRAVTNTAAALHRQHIEALERIFPGARIYSMYGLTECKRCTYLPPEDIHRKPTSVGIAIPNTELWIEDENGQRLGPGKTGMLVIRGATIMRGYWGKPKETARKLRPGPLPGELVLHTGDLCKLDEEGYLYFVARTDDIIKTQGEKVSPVEVERALCEISGVKEAAVLGVPDEILGAAVKAFIVVDDGVSLSEKEVQKECQRRLENFMVPKYVETVRELPKGITGKIDKADLR